MVMENRKLKMDVNGRRLPQTPKGALKVIRSNIIIQSPLRGFQGLLAIENFVNLCALVSLWQKFPAKPQRNSIHYSQSTIHLTYDLLLTTTAFSLSSCILCIFFATFVPANNH